MSKAIIFGAGGQTGYYLSRLLSDRGVHVVKTSLHGSDVPVDVACFSAVENLIGRCQPAMLFHLASKSTTQHDAVFDNHAAIATGALNILEAARRHAPQARIFIAGSGLQFVNTGEPIAEDAPFEASSPYAVARISAAYAARYYRKRGLAVYVGYLFHHESPRRPPQYVSQQVAQAVRAIAAGRKQRLDIGDLTVRREWTFAGDVAEAIAILTQQDRVMEAVIGSGQGYTIEQWVEACFSSAKLEWKRYVHIIPGFQPDYQQLVSNPHRIFSLGWKPVMPLGELARLMVAGEIPFRRAGG